MGHEAGGAMAYFVAFRLRDIVGGLVAVDAAMSSLLRPPDADPVRPLSFFVASADQSRVAARIKSSIDTLREMKHAVTVRSLGEAPRGLNQTELQELARWIDALDRM
jgi:hypothetical protein